MDEEEEGQPVEAESEKGPLERSGVRIRKGSRRGSRINAPERIATLEAIPEKTPPKPQPLNVQLNQEQLEHLERNLKSVSERADQELQDTAGLKGLLLRQKSLPSSSSYQQMQSAPPISFATPSRALQEAVLEATTASTKVRSVRPAIQSPRAVHRGRIVLEDIWRRPNANSGSTQDAFWISHSIPSSSLSPSSASRKQVVRDCARPVTAPRELVPVLTDLGQEPSSEADLLRETNNGLMGGTHFFDQGGTLSKTLPSFPSSPKRGGLRIDKLLSPHSSNGFNGPRTTRRALAYQRRSTR